MTIEGKGHLRLFDTSRCTLQQGTCLLSVYAQGDICGQVLWTDLKAY